MFGIRNKLCLEILREPFSAGTLNARMA